MRLANTVFPLPCDNRVLDKDKDDLLNLDELVVYVAEVKKTGLVEVTTLKRVVGRR
jgi:hypothetical protein